MARFNDVTLGMEFEVNTHETMSRCTTALNDHGLYPWRVVSDGSVSGWEFVSPALNHDEAQEGIARLAGVFSQIGASAGRQCGLHIHAKPIGYDWTTEELKMVLRRFVKYEDCFDVLQPVTRRGSANTYCQSNAKVFSDRERFGLRASDTPDEVARHIWRIFDGMTSRSQVRDMFAPGQDRYFKMNPVALLRHGTIEFRHPAGTADATVASEFVEFYYHWLRFTFNLERIWKPFKDDSFETRFDKLFYRLPARVKRNMVKRRAAIAAGSL